MLLQRTLKRKTGCTGIGLHSGRRARIDIYPAPDNTGIIFIRKDAGQNIEIQAKPQNVVSTELCTTLGSNGYTVSTVEHLMSAFYGLGIDNAIVEVDGPEVPILDGSAAPFVFLLRTAGIRRQTRPKRFMIVRRNVSARNGGAEARLTKSRNFCISCSIDFDHVLVPFQTFRFKFSDRNFVNEICRARTFGFLKDVEQMHRMGLALGGSLENAVVVDDLNVLNSAGLRYQNEFIRHKVLDAIGDLALLGCLVVGHLVTLRSGHTLNNLLLSKFIEDRNSYELVEVSEPKEARKLQISLPVWALDAAR